MEADADRKPQVVICSPTIPGVVVNPPISDNACATDFGGDAVFAALRQICIRNEAAREIRLETESENAEFLNSLTE